jgi:hypothetical protein
MNRYIEIECRKRKVRCVARLLTERAPRTCAAVWDVLPQEGDAYHAKYASNEIYTLVAAFPDKSIGLEYSSIVPTAGDVGYFYLPAGVRLPKAAEEAGLKGKAAVDLALFYERNNILLSPSEGFLPCNVFATVVRNLDEMAAAGASIWREGFVGERLAFRRLEGNDLKQWGLTE